MFDVHWLQKPHSLGRESRKKSVSSIFRWHSKDERRDETTSSLSCNMQSQIYSWWEIMTNLSWSWGLKLKFMFIAHYALEIRSFWWQTQFLPNLTDMNVDSFEYCSYRQRVWDCFHNNFWISYKQRIKLCYQWQPFITQVETVDKVFEANRQK